MTDASQIQKVRGLESRISMQSDPYVRTISPERLWTLLAGTPTEKESVKSKHCRPAEVISR